MSTDLKKIKKLNELVSLSFRRRHIIVLDPDEKQENVESLEPNVVYDKAGWYIDDEIKDFVEELSKNNELSKEEKILVIFERLCHKYVYDDNLISYIHKIDDDIFDLPDWYGRDVDEVWIKNREQHNRRICYEIARYYAKALKILFDGNDDYNICILWDKGHTHYFVGLTCSEYSITLDLDDFNNIKDLTRLKTGLTAEGIKVLEDKNGKFQQALDRFNSGRSKYAIKDMETRILGKAEETKTEEAESLTFIRNVLEILKTETDIDSQGLYEYLKEIIDITLGPEAREKVWKKIEGKSATTRCVRCLVINIDGQKYIIDVEDKELRPFEDEEFSKEESPYIPYKDLYRDWNLKESRYDGK